MPAKKSRAKSRAKSSRCKKSKCKSSRGKKSSRRKGKMPPQVKDWMRFVKQTRKDYPNLTYGEALKKAKKPYHAWKKSKGL